MASAEQVLVYPFASNQDSVVYNDFDDHGSYCGAPYYCQGVDYDESYGTPVYAALSGTVVVVDGESDQDSAPGCNVTAGYGNYVKITSGSWEVIYGHMANGRMEASNGGSVTAGQLLGYTSNSGYTCGEDVNGSAYHLHFEVEYNNVDKDPYAEGYFIIDDDESYRYPSEANSCTTHTGTVLMTHLDDVGEEYEIYSYYQTSVNDDLEECGRVSEDTGQPVNTRAWYAAEVTGDEHEDLVQITTTENHTYAWVYRATGNGGFYDKEQWKETGTASAAYFVGDTNNDDLTDLILGYADVNDEYRVQWKICPSNGTTFISCETWSTDQDPGGREIFGQYGDIFVSGDFYGNGKIEILRGREGTDDCGSKLKWKRLKSNGDTQTFSDCWGYADSVYLADDVDNDSHDEIVQVQTIDQYVEVYVRYYDTGESKLKPEAGGDWADDVGGVDGRYYLYYVDDDNLPDLI